MSEEVSKIRKRDGRIVDFDQKKITNAILKALTAAKHGNGELAKGLSDSVVKLVNERFAGKFPVLRMFRTLLRRFWSRTVMLM